MRKLIAILFGAVVVGMTGSAIAQTTAPSKKEERAMAKKEARMKAMDVNNDGMISREEFMKYHETTWEKIKRNAAGLAKMGDVESMYGPGTVPSAIPGEPPAKAKP